MQELLFASSESNLRVEAENQKNATQIAELRKHTVKVVKENAAQVAELETQENVIEELFEKKDLKKGFEKRSVSFSKTSLKTPSVTPKTIWVRDDVLCGTNCVAPLAAPF